MKKHDVLNPAVILDCLLGVLLVGLAAAAAKDGDHGMAVAFSCVTLIPVAILVLFPIGYRFDEKGVTLGYLFLPNERYLWENIHAVTVENWGSNSNPTLLLWIYRLDGICEGRERFYMRGEIAKTFRTKRLITRYWDGTIEGYFDDVKTGFRKLRAKREKQATIAKKRSADEIKAEERALRAEVRRILAPYFDCAKQRDLTAALSFQYGTEDGTESHSRPEEAYCYLAVILLSRSGETDEENRREASVDLMRVRLGKTSYRGVRNPHMAVELKETAEALLADNS
ncbi:MAG: hypothetical protein E7618_01905 [Ruminococcaceae bacterium]|nr:hypothetical protein [Oscillospiraceae bacterium]